MATAASAEPLVTVPASTVPATQVQPRNSIRRVALTGFMGAGKSTVGRLLALRLGWSFQDVDLAIESDHGMTVAALFAGRGEPWFREAEHAKVRALLAADNLVLGLGGGAIEDSGTRDLLLSDPASLLVHLEASFETVLARCRGTEDVRPVLRDRARLQSRYDERLPLYRLAHWTIAVDSLPADAVASAIAAYLHQHGHALHGHAPYGDGSGNGRISSEPK